MNRRRVSTALTSLITSGAMLLLAAAGALAQDVPIVQPGAPGQKTTKLTAQQAVKIADTRYAADDVTFMRDMIHHHDQAVQMAEAVKDRTNLPNWLRWRAGSTRRRLTKSPSCRIGCVNAARACRMRRCIAGWI